MNIVNYWLSVQMRLLLMASANQKAVALTYFNDQPPPPPHTQFTLQVKWPEELKFFNVHWITSTLDLCELMFVYI